MTGADEDFGVGPALPTMKFIDRHEWKVEDFVPNVKVNVVGRGVCVDFAGATVTISPAKHDIPAHC
jgi:hypothetical protein